MPQMRIPAFRLFSNSLFRTGIFSAKITTLAKACKKTTDS